MDQMQRTIFSMMAFKSNLIKMFFKAAIASQGFPNIADLIKQNRQNRTVWTSTKAQISTSEADKQTLLYTLFLILLEKWPL